MGVKLPYVVAATAVMMAALGASAFQTPIIFPLLWMAKRLTQHHPRVGSLPHMPLMPPLASRLKIFVAIKDGQKNDNIETMVEWLDGMDGTSSSVKVDSNSFGLRGLYATKDIRSGEIIVEIPYDAALLVGDTLWATIPDDFDDVPGSDDWSEEDLDDTYQGLNFLQTFNKDVDYGPYIINLPPVPSSGDEAGLTPDFWSKEFILGWEVPTWTRAILDRKQIVQEVAKKNNVDENELRWATWMMRSRRFTTWNMVDDPDIEDDQSLFGVFPVLRKKIEQVQGFLIPLIDMANHAHDPNGVMKISVNRWTREFDDTSTFALRALKPIKKGEEVTLSYGDGDRTSLDLLDKYGFFLEGNEADNTIDWDELKPEFTTSLEEDRAALAMLEGKSHESKKRVLSKTTDKLKTIVSKIQDYEPQFPTKLDDLDLVGSGIRQKMGIKIYGVAMYSSPSLIGVASSYDLWNAARTFEASPRTTFVLEMILQADADTIAEAIADSVKLRYGGPQADVQYLEALIVEQMKEKVGRQASKGCSLKFDCTENGVSLSVDGAAQVTAKFKGLGSALVDVFLDESTVSPSLVDSCLEREVNGAEEQAVEVSEMADQAGIESRRTMLSLRVLMKRLSGWKPTAVVSPTSEEAIVNGAILEHKEEIVGGSETSNSSGLSAGVPDKTGADIIESSANDEIETPAPSDEDVELLEPDFTEVAIDENEMVASFVDNSIVPLEPDAAPDDDVELLEPDILEEEDDDTTVAEVDLEDERKMEPAPVGEPGKQTNTGPGSAFDANVVEARIRQLEAEIEAEIARVKIQDTQPVATSGGTQNAISSPPPVLDASNEVAVQGKVEDNQVASEEEARQNVEAEERQRAAKKMAEKAAAEAKQRYEAVEGKAISLKDKATGVTFDPKLEGVQNNMYLVGVGVRKKAIINVYAVAMYSSPSPMEALSPFQPGGKQKKEAQMALKNAARTFDDSTPTTSFVLEMVFKADAQAIAGALADGVKPRYSGPAADVKELEALIIDGMKSKGGQATKGTVFRFDCTSKGVSVSVDGNMQGTASFAGMGEAFVDVFMDEKAVSPQLVDSCLNTWCGSGV